MPSLKSELEEKRKLFYKRRKTPTHFLLTPDKELESTVPLSIAFLKAHAYYVVSLNDQESLSETVNVFFEKAYAGEKIDSRLYKTIKQEFANNISGVL